MPDYMPGGDAAFNGWQANFVSYATAHLAELGLAAGDLTPITTAQTAWTGSYTAHLAAQAAAQAARTTKDGNRTALETLIRALVRRLQASPQVSDGERAALGITVPDREPTPVGAPTTRPLASVDAAQRLRHVIDFSDEASPTSKAKPAGVIGAEIWVKVGGTPPVDPGELTFLAVDTRTPYTANYSGSDGGQPAHYMLRWVNSRGETGPWSETITTTIGA